MDIDGPNGHMFVDIGGGTTDIAVVSKGAINTSKSIKVASGDFDDAIIKYLRKKYGVLLGDMSAEQLKIEIGAVYPREQDAVGYAKGKELMKGLPTKLPVHSSEIEEATGEVANTIVEAVRQVLENTPPELVNDIAEFGIVLSGGGSKIYGMDKLIEEKTGVRVRKMENPELVVATGAGTARKYVAEEVVITSDV